MINREKSPLRKLIDERGIRHLDGVHSRVRVTRQETVCVEINFKSKYTK